MTQPDPDPTNREQILDEWQKAVDAAGGGGNTLDLLQALMAAGYQIVPKVELEGLRDAALTFKAKHEGFHPDHWVAAEPDQYCAACDLCAALQALDKENG